MEHDKFGITLGDYVYLRSPVMDNTYPTLAAAMVAASEWLLDGCERVRVYAVTYSERKDDYVVRSLDPLIDAYADVEAIDTFAGPDSAG